MSKGEPQDRQFMRRTMLISGGAIAIFSIILALLAAPLSPVADFVTSLGPVLWGLLGILLLTLTFIGLVIFFGNLREWYGEAAGWFEVIILWVIVIIVGTVGFNLLVGVITALLCVGVIYYIHIVQE